METPAVQPRFYQIRKHFYSFSYFRQKSDTYFDLANLLQAQLAGLPVGKKPIVRALLMHGRVDSRNSSGQWEATTREEKSPADPQHSL
ncbi:hypothetical protein NPIL_421021 [Nephila pilipes]|uniref:Uncharacterized protein n=1 Tax=Nephila pilipes TaxID=299642 RepID=A0A8X6QJV3_NEPPI|nr:hypothetical protein NPIL_421021 [Nephila pilipes]